MSTRKAAVAEYNKRQQENKLEQAKDKLDRLEKSDPTNSLLAFYFGAKTAHRRKENKIAKLKREIPQIESNIVECEAKLESAKSHVIKKYTEKREDIEATMAEMEAKHGVINEETQRATGIAAVNLQKENPDIKLKNNPAYKGHISYAELERYNMMKRMVHHFDEEIASVKAL